MNIKGKSEMHSQKAQVEIHVCLAVGGSERANSENPPTNRTVCYTNFKDGGAGVTNS